MSYTLPVRPGVELVVTDVSVLDTSMNSLTSAPDARRSSRGVSDDDGAARRAGEIANWHDLMNLPGLLTLSGKSIFREPPSQTNNAEHRTRVASIGCCGGFVHGSIMQLVKGGVF